MQDQELFQDYEVGRWKVGPRVYKIIAASAILNIAVLLGAAQSNLLTMKGCESPLVGNVCTVIDTLVVGGTALTTDSTYIDGDYEKTDISDADIVWVDQTGVEKFQYPADYWATANPELLTPQEIPNDDGSFPSYIPGTNPTTSNPTIGGGTSDLLNKPQELPKKNDNAISGNLPDSPFDVVDNPTTKPGKAPRYVPRRLPKNNPTLTDNSPNTLPQIDGNATKDPTTKPKDPKNPNGEIEINKKPLRDYADIVRVKFEKKEIDLTQNFKIVADGFLTKDGKLDVSEDPKTKKPRFQITAAEGNEQMVEIVKQAIAAIGDSGWLGYLRAQGIDKIKFQVVQDNDNLQVIILSDLPTKERAQTVANGLNGAIGAAKFADENNIKKLGDDEKLLLSKASVLVNPQNAKQFVLNFVIPKPIAHEMITRKLTEPRPETEQPKPNGGTAQIKDTSQKAGK